MRASTRTILLCCLILTGCSQSSYLSPQVGVEGAKYTYGGSGPVPLSQSPEGVGFDVSGLHFVVGNPQCGKSIGGVPPLPVWVTTDHPTATFGVKVDISGEGITYDWKQTLLRTSYGSWVQASSPNPGTKESSTAIDDFIVFDAECDVENTYDLHIDGVKKNGQVVQVPIIRFARGGATTLGTM
ncbi:MAG TPA: hypothetical protein VIX59_01810 [Candidatus Binataceae bacterium]